MQRDQIDLAVGIDLDSYTPHFRVQSIAIDNRTGSWLHVEGLNQFVPPYTIGWVRNYEWTTGSVTVRFVSGPSGSSSVESGDGAVIWLHDTKVTQSDGVQYYNARQPTIRALTSQTGIVAVGAIDTFQVPPATIGLGPKQHLRLYGFELGNQNDARPVRQNVLFRVWDGVALPGQGVGPSIGTLSVNPNRAFDRLWFPQPIDIPLGYTWEIRTYNKDATDTLTSQSRTFYGII